MKAEMSKKQTEKTLEKLFVDRPSQADVLNSRGIFDAKRYAVVNVWRNHSFELVADMVTPYGEYAGWQFEFRLSGYDDSLIFDGHEDADFELLWIDRDRYASQLNDHEWASWLVERVGFLRTLTDAPIVICSWLSCEDEAKNLENQLHALAAVYFADLKGFSSDTGLALFDPDAASLTGTPISRRIYTLLGRKLALHWIGGALFDQVKAIVVDLDNTLHTGVLGEDGPAGVVVDGGQAELHRILNTLAAEGIMVSIATKNNPDDVAELLSHPEYPLKKNLLTSIHASWSPKRQMIEEVLKATKVGSDALLFVDDNPGEILDVKLGFPDINIIDAHDNGRFNKLLVEYYPGVWRWSRTSEDSKRVLDLQANVQRSALSDSLNDVDYYASLGLKLTINQNREKSLVRVAELLKKTNQFNLSLKRTPESRVREYMFTSGYFVLDVSLKDKLSDSGIVAAVLCRTIGDELMIDEVCISCRALGRRAETVMIFEALKLVLHDQGSNTLVFFTRNGPRNQPARDWLNGLLPDTEKLPKQGEVRIPAATINNYITPPEVGVERGKYVVG